MESRDNDTPVGRPSEILRIVLSRRSSLADYTLASVVALISLGIAMVARMHNWGMMYTAPLTGSVLVAVFFGRGPALFCSIISALGIDYWIIGAGEPSKDPTVIFRLLLFVILTTIVSQVTSELRRGYLQAEHLKRESDRQVAIRQHVVDIVSHDLRNPLSSIQMYTSLLLNNLSSSQKVDASKVLQGILRSTERMARITSDLLAASQIEIGSFSITPANESLDNIINETLDAFRQKARLNHVKLEFNPMNLGIQIFADRSRLVQALSNLVENALKYSPEEGTIRFDTTEKDGILFISVSDQGPGISPEKMTHIFERYWTEAQGSNQGTGLGLFIARGIMRSHGGNLTVAPNPKGGTIFTLSLPLSGSKVQKAA